MAAGGLGSLAAAAALVGIRSEIASVNVALVLVLFVVLGAVIGGRQAGVISATVAAVAFDFFHTQPYGSLKMANGDDVVTTVLLVVVGLAIGEIALQTNRLRATAGEDRRQLRRLHRVAELAAGGESTDDLVLAVIAELMDTLDLDSCTFERPPFVYELPLLEHRVRSWPPSTATPKAASSFPVKGWLYPCATGARRSAGSCSIPHRAWPLPPSGGSWPSPSPTRSASSSLRPIRRDLVRARSRSPSPPP